MTVLSITKAGGSSGSLAGDGGVIVVHEGDIHINEPVVFHAPNAAARLRDLNSAQFEFEMESLLEYGADVRKNMVTTAHMAMLDTKLLEVTHNLAQTGDELVKNVAAVNQEGGQAIIGEFVAASKSFAEVMAQYKKSLSDDSADAEARFAAARTKLMADDAVAAHSGGAS